jgi:hypothetical protein
VPCAKVNFGPTPYFLLNGINSKIQYVVRSKKYNILVSEEHQLIITRLASKERVFEIEVRGQRKVDCDCFCFCSSERLLVFVVPRNWKRSRVGVMRIRTLVLRTRTRLLKHQTSQISIVKKANLIMKNYFALLLGLLLAAPALVSSKLGKDHRDACKSVNSCLTGPGSGGGSHFELNCSPHGYYCDCLENEKSDCEDLLDIVSKCNDASWTLTKQYPWYYSCEP